MNAQRFKAITLVRSGARWATVAALAVGALACGRRDELGVRRTSPESARGDATISGRVTLTGTPPVRQTIRNEPCHDHAKPFEDETVLVDPSGGLANVFIYLLDGPKVDGLTLDEVVLDQVDCRYVPHVVGVVAHQRLVIKSSDPTFHNVHYTPKKNRPDNFGLRREGHQKTVSFAAPEIFHVRCDVHSWMSAYIGVFDNELFGISQVNGSFSIPNVPAGTYTLVAWHELYGEQRQQITVERGSTVRVDLDFVAP